MNQSAGPFGRGDAGDERPSTARIYDYLLGGHHNFAADRVAGERMRVLVPHAPLVMQANRAFLRRAVTFLVEQGIEQFLDLGSGIPTMGNVHEVAQALNPNARIVYVDRDPVAIQHSASILEGNPKAAALHGDIRAPEEILQQPQARALLDLQQPLGVLLVAVLHFVPTDEEASAIVHLLRNRVARDSYFAIAHGTDEGVPRELVEEGERLYAQTSTPGRLRTRAEILRLFDGLDLIEPGLVWAPLWRPERPDDLLVDRPEASMNLVGVGRRP